MRVYRWPKRWVVPGVIALALLACGVVAGAVLAGQFRGEDPAELEAALLEAPVVRVADLPAAAGHAGRGVFVQSTSTGLFCLWDAPSATSRERQGGCNRADDPLGGRKLSASLSYDGGPDPRSVTDARLVGLVAREVASVRILMSDGTQRAVRMQREAAVATADGSFRVFAHRVAATDLARGLGPVAVLALDARGTEVDRQATGFGG